MTTFEKLKKKLTDELGLNCRNFRRTRAGYWQRAAGAFVWVADEILEDTLGGQTVGSSWPASYLIKKNVKFEILRDAGDTEIFPVLGDRK